MASQDNQTSRGVKQDFPLRNNVVTNIADIKSGIIKPTKALITHPDTLFDLLNASATATTQDLINGYFFSSTALTAGRTLTVPPATSITAYLARLLGKTATTIPGTSFSFVVDNTQAGAFTITLTTAAGVTLQGTGFDLSQNEIATFNLVVHDNNEVVISRDDSGTSAVETLAETLAAGNTTGSNDIVITSGDSITGTGPIPITSSFNGASAITLIASGAASSMIGNVGTGGFTYTSNGIISLQATDEATLSSAEATATAVNIVASDAAGGITLTAGTNGIDEISVGTIVLNSTAGSFSSQGLAGWSGTSTGSMLLQTTAALPNAINIDATAGSINLTATALGQSVDIDSAEISFFAHGSATQQTVLGALSTVADAPAQAVLTSIIAALESYGLVIDGTT